MDVEALIESRDLVTRWMDLRERERAIRQRDGAARLGVTEAELVAAHVGTSATRLRADWAVLLHRLETLGPVTALARNQHAVIEKTGIYRGVSVEGGIARMRGEGVNFAASLAEWHVGFAVTERGRRGPRRSVQLFDPSGVAIHKVFLTGASDVEAFDALVELHASDDQRAVQPVGPAARREVERQDEAVDACALRTKWEQLQDGRDFTLLTRRMGVSRAQALRLAGPRWSQRVPASSHRSVLEDAAASGLPLTTVVANRGIAQMHSGPVECVREVDGWFNVLAPSFKVHIDEAGTASAWVVRMPTRHGVATSLELYDRAGEMIVLLTSGRPQRQTVDLWREVVAAVDGSSAPSAAE